jgi:uncharacterized protein (TIGR00251 family)
MKIFVLVKPHAKQSKVIKVSENEFHVFVTEPPQENKANESVIKMLSEYFNIPKSNVILLHGKKSKRKVFVVPDLCLKK